MLTIVGLGPGDPELVTRKAWRKLEESKVVYLRTKHHPTVESLPGQHKYRSFDDLYDSAQSFEEVYATIVETLVALARTQDVVYAVPGDPTIAETAVFRLLAACEAEGISSEVMHGVSFIEPVLAAVQVDAGAGLQLFDALDIAQAYHPPINPDYPAIITQIYSQQVASDVKLTLMNQYPDEFQVMLIHAAGTPAQRIEAVSLYEIDRGNLADLSSLVVPAYFSDGNKRASFEAFQDTIAKLRDPSDGCPWDIKQTHASLKKYLIEETYEVIDAIGDVEQDPMHLAEEFGDLLLQIVLHTQVAIDEGEFRMADVIQHIDSKIKRRHPHVWGDVNVNGSAETVATNWEAIKAQERAAKNGEEPKFESILDGVPKSLPALLQGHMYDLRAIKVGFDWSTEDGVRDKVAEEIQEIIEAETQEERLDELGDLLLTICVWARWLDVNPEDALRFANQKFYRRFSTMEKLALEQNLTLTDLSFEQWDDLWRQAKATLSS